MRVFHPGEAGRELMYRCSFCEKGFLHVNTLKNHLKRAHLTDQRVNCETCGKDFLNTEELKRHKRIHAPPALKCPQCDKFFRLRQHVIQHLRGCHYPPMYECLSCGQTYHHKPAARIHLRKAHSTHSFDESVKIHDIDMSADIALIK